MAPSNRGSNLHKCTRLQISRNVWCGSNTLKIDCPGAHRSGSSEYKIVLYIYYIIYICIVLKKKKNVQFWTVFFRYWHLFHLLTHTTFTKMFVPVVPFVAAAVAVDRTWLKPAGDSVTMCNHPNFWAVLSPSWAIHLENPKPDIIYIYI